jgi:hypothetical protein
MPPDRQARDQAAATALELPTDKAALSQAFANTYNTTADATPWELCQQYLTMLDYTAQNPDAGRHAVANAIGEEIPPGRVRPWLDNSMPDAMRGIQACEAHGWLDLTWDGPTLHNLGVLIAWVFSGGSITSHWVPQLAVEDKATEQRAYRLLRALDEQPEAVRADDAGRATEVRPTEDAAPLGRLVTVLGAPQGVKNRQTNLSLPPWLTNAAHSIQLAFARTYVMNRATPRDDRPQTPVQMAEQRSPGYRQELTTFFDAVADADVTRGDSETIRLTQAGANRLHQPPAIHGDSNE